MRAESRDHQFGFRRNVQTLPVDAAPLEDAERVVGHPPHVAVGVPRQQRVSRHGKFGRIRAAPDIGDNLRGYDLLAAPGATASHEFPEAA